VDNADPSICFPADAVVSRDGPSWPRRVVDIRPGSVQLFAGPALAARPAAAVPRARPFPNDAPSRSTDVLGRAFQSASMRNMPTPEKPIMLGPQEAQPNVSSI